MNNFLSRSDLIEILATFITIIGTYFITKFQIMNPHKIEIKQCQLKNVYLPLYKLLIDSHVEYVGKDKQMQFIDKVTEIIEDNYLFIYPDLLKTYENLKLYIQSGNDISKSYSKFKSIVFYDYEKSKRALGYPSVSYGSFFARIDTPSKLKEILGWLSLVLIFGPAIYFASLENLSSFSFSMLFVLYTAIFVGVKEISGFLTSFQRRK